MIDLKSEKYEQNNCRSMKRWTKRDEIEYHLAMEKMMIQRGYHLLASSHAMFAEDCIAHNQ